MRVEGGGEIKKNRVTVSIKLYLNNMCWIQLTQARRADSNLSGIIYTSC